MEMGQVIYHSTPLNEMNRMGMKTFVSIQNHLNLRIAGGIRYFASFQCIDSPLIAHYLQ